METISKLQDIITEQNETFVDRHTEVLIMWLAILSGTNTFFLGIPGVAKSMTIRDMVRRISGARLFEKLFMKDTSRYEVLGQPNIKAVKEKGVLEFITTNMLPEAEVVFLDELFKGSSAVTNTLLTALNEKEFDNGGIRIKIPLISAFAASNELPSGEETGAIFDRFLLRVHTKDLSDSDFMVLLGKEPKLSGSPTQVSLDEVKALQAEVAKVVVPDEVKNRIGDLRALLRAEGKIEFGPRRWLQGLGVVRANALLNGRTEAIDEDIEVYQHMLWNDLDQKPRAEKIVLSTVNPLNMRFLEMVDMAEEGYHAVRDEIQRDGMEVQSLSLEHHQALKRILDEMEALAKKSNNATFQAKVTQEQKKVKQYLRYVVEEGLGVQH